RVDEDRDDHEIRLPSTRLDQGGVPLVQGAHRGDQADAMAAGAGRADAVADRLDRLDGGDRRVFGIHGAADFLTRCGQAGLSRQSSEIRRSGRISPWRSVFSTIRETSSVVTWPYQMPWG